MPTEAKRETVAELREELAGSRTLIVSEYRGLTVKEIAEIRRALRKQDVTYRVVKNRLMRIAAAGLDRRGPRARCSIGPTAIAFGNDEAATAKAVIDATRPYKPVVKITGGVLGRPGDRRRRRHAPGHPAVARGAPRPSWPAGCRRRSPRWPACSSRTSANLG